MIFSLAIYAPPSSQASYSAYQFACALLKENHTLYRVFFYHEGVQHGSKLICPPQDELNLCEQWQALQKQYNVDIVFCIAAALKRGLLDTTEAERYEKASSNLAEGFELSGLGQLVDATTVSERIITFGA